MRLLRVRLVTRWAFTLFPAALAVVALLSVWQHVCCWGIVGLRQVRIGMDRGIGYVVVESPLRVGRFAGWGAAAQGCGPGLNWAYWRWPSEEMAGGGQSYRMLAGPFWAWVVCSGLLAGPFWIGAGIAWRRRRKGLCAQCGYDRRGLGAQARCPECGGALKPSPAAIESSGP